MAKLPDGWVAITHVDRKGISIDMETKELITCKSCKHDRNGYCLQLDIKTTPDWFCADGEKEDD